MLNRHLRALLPVILLTAAIGYADSAGYTNMIDLAGDWQVQAQDQTWRDLKVPGSLESQIAELRSYSGQAVYKKELPIPETWKGKRILLKFGAVDWLAEVSVNGESIGAHEGGYTPFQFDITDQIKIGEWNDLEVAVTDVTPERSFATLVFDEIPHGRQGWHGPQSGIWQGVTLEAAEPVTIARIRVTPDITSSSVLVNVSLRRASDAGELRLIVTGEGAVHHTTVIPVKADQTDYETEIKLDAPKLWAPDSPYLYKLQARVKIGAYETDSESVEFGMRKIEVKNNRIYLNGEPIFVTGVLDQDYYPLTEYTPPSDEFLRTQFQRARHMGINLVRCQAKIPDPRYLAWADRVGLIVWYEMPGFGKLTDRSQARSRILLTESLQRDYNHASLCMVSLVGDGWGIDPNNAEHRNWQRVMYEDAKALDPTRLIIDNSSSGAYHIETDIEDSHHSLMLTDQPGEFARWVSNVVSHPEAEFSPLGDSGRRGWEPLLISDAGNWGLPKISDIKKTYNGDPWWFESGSGPSKAAGVEERFKEQGLDRVFGSMDALAEACQCRQWVSLKSRIEEMRKHPELGGYVIGQFSDVNWEADGLLDANRSPKVFYDEVRSVQACDVIIPDWQTVNYWSGAPFSLDVLVSHMSRNKLEGGTLTWRLEGFSPAGKIAGVSVTDLNVANVGAIGFTVPSVEKPTKTRLTMALLSKTGEAIAENYCDICIFPAARPASGTDVAVWDPDGKLKDLRSRLSSGGYTVLDAMNRGTVALTTRLDDAVREFALKGGRVILVADGPDSIPDLVRSDLAVVPRSASGPWSDLSKCVMWIRNAGPMRGVAFDPVPGFYCSEMFPRSVLVGLDVVKNPNDVFGGLFVGWLQNPAAVAAQFKAGDGKVFATTLDLLRSYGSDPAATTLLGDIIAHVAGKDFNPSTRIDLAQVSTDAPNTEFGPGGWRFTTDSPGEAWTEVSFYENGWKSVSNAVGSAYKPGTVIRTAWEPSGLWMRKVDEIAGSVTRARITYVSDEPFDLYLNGRPVLQVDLPVSHPQAFDFGPDALKLFKPGKNVLAVCSHQKPGGRPPEIGLKYGVN